MAAQMTRGIPLGFYDLPLIRSYSKLGDDGNLYRVEVRGIAGNHPVQATFPMPSRAQPKYRARHIDTLGSPSYEMRERV